MRTAEQTRKLQASLHPPETRVERLINQAIKASPDTKYVEVEITRNEVSLVRSLGYKVECVAGNLYQVRW
jgi:hypothetical protein